MKTLIVYYSRTGVTRKVADNLSFWIKAKKEEVIDKKDRKGPIGYVIAGKDASAKKLTEISHSEYDLKEFNQVIIGTPIWAWTIAPAIRTYIEKNKEILKDKELAFFCTMGGSGDKQAFEVMEKIIGRKPKATFSLKTREVINSEYETKIREFAKKL